MDRAVQLARLEEDILLQIHFGVEADLEFAWPALREFTGRGDIYFGLGFRLAPKSTISAESADAILRKALESAGLKVAEVKDDPVPPSGQLGEFYLSGRARRASP